MGFDLSVSKFLKCQDFLIKKKAFLKTKTKSIFRLFEVPQKQDKGLGTTSLTVYHLKWGQNSNPFTYSVTEQKKYIILSTLIAIYLMQTAQVLTKCSLVSAIKTWKH